MSDKVGIRLKIEDAIRIEKYYPPGKNGGRKNQYIFKCKNCDNELIVRKARLNKTTGLCVICNNRSFIGKALDARRLKPYGALFNRIKDSATKRDIDFKFTYEEFITLTKIDKCHYCFKDIKFKKYGTSTYNLDRKDNVKGYEIDNLVVCCDKCNKGKRELFSYEEWYGMTEYFRNKINI